MTLTLVAEGGLPGPGVSGLYAVRVADGHVKFGHSRNIASRLVSHHRALRHLGVEFVAAWMHCPDSAAAERELLARLSRSGFERLPASEAFAIAWPVALRLLAAAATRSAVVE